VWSIAA
jgi:hypothetical protein